SLAARTGLAPSARTRFVGAPSRPAALRDPRSGVLGSALGSSALQQCKAWMGSLFLFLNACRGFDCAEEDSRCEGNLAVRCDEAGGGGRLISRTDCEDRFCIVGKQFPFCALSATPDPLCTPGALRACDGNTSVACTDEFRTQIENCELTSRYCIPPDAQP